MNCYRSNCTVRGNITSNIYYCCNLFCQWRQPFPVERETTNQTNWSMQKDGGEESG